MRHQVEHGQITHHTLACQHGDGVSVLHTEPLVDIQVGIHHDHVSHLACAQAMHAQHARRVFQHAADLTDLLFGSSAVHQIVQRVPTEAQAHAPHHQPHDKGRDGVQQRQSCQTAPDAQRHHQR